MARNCEYKRSLDYTQEVCMMVSIGANQTIVEGDLLMLDATNGLAVKASSAATKVIGIAKQAITTGATVGAKDQILVTLLSDKSVFRMKYSGTTKTSLAAADTFGKAAFDITSGQVLNLDDTTGGFLLVVGFDNDNGMADVVVKASALWNA